MRDLRIWFLLLFAMLTFSCSDDSEPEIGPSDLEVSSEILTLVNEHRTNKGLVSLEQNSNCAEIALKHSQNMANGITPYGHDGYGQRFAILMVEIDATAFGENVAKGYTNAEHVMTDWLNSPTHRDNIEGDFTDIGIGVHTSEEGIMYYTQVFVRR